MQTDVKGNIARLARNKADLEALMFERGGEANHWTVWDPSANTYVPRPTDSSDETALPGWFFRATSNLMGVKIDGIASILNQSQPAQEFAPATEDEKDRAGAELAEAAVPVLRDEIEWASLRSQIHKLICLTNGVALHLYYDTDEKHGMEDMPVLQCAQCQEYYLPSDVGEGDPCPSCGGAVDWAVHPQTQQPMGAPMPKGKIAARLLNSFEWSIPKAARAMHEEQVAWIAGHGRMAPHEILRLWPTTAKGKVDPDRGANAASRGSGTTSVAYADQARALSGPGGTGDVGGVGSARVVPTGQVVWMVWADPVDDDDFYFPEGLYAAALEEDAVLESGPLPLKDDKGRPVKNVLLRGFAGTPGSPWNKPPSDDLIPLQKQLNLCQALAFLILMHDAAPITFLPDTVTLLDDLTGLPGATVPFKAMRAGDKPIIEQGKGFPPSLQWFMDYLVNQFDVVSKLNAVLAGARPAGDPTLGEVEILQQQGLSAFREPLQELINFEIRLSRMLLWTARQSAWTPRFYTVAGDNGEWEVKSFLGLDLEGSVNITCEPMSAWPTSPVLMQFRVQQALELGMLNPQDPEVQSEYLTMNDLTRFKSSTDEDRKQVARQLDAWRQAVAPQQIQPPDPLWNLPVHFFLKSTFLKTEEAEQMAADPMRAPVYQAIRQHVLMIQQMLQQQQLAAQGVHPQPPAKPGEKGGPPVSGKAVAAHVQAGHIRPASTQPKKPNGQLLNGMLKSGAVRVGQPAPPKGKPAGRKAGPMNRPPAPSPAGMGGVGMPT